MAGPLGEERSPFGLAMARGSLLIDRGALNAIGHCVHLAQHASANESRVAKGHAHGMKRHRGCASRPLCAAGGASEPAPGPRGGTREAARAVSWAGRGAGIKKTHPEQKPFWFQKDPELRRGRRAVWSFGRAPSGPTAAPREAPCGAAAAPRRRPPPL